MVGALLLAALAGLTFARPSGVGSPSPWVAVSAVAAQPEHGPAAAPGPGQPAAEHGESIWTVVARLVNFAILAGVLIALFRSPLADYLKARAEQIRRDLANAATMQAESARQIEEIGRTLQALPAELEALKARGAEEVAAEAARIRQVAEAGRQRLLDQMRREIDMQLRIARRELVRHAADLAVGVAAERITRQMTDADQARLVDEYIERVKQN